ncbi:tRNA-intron lyase [Candidatus Bathyarchaeota archaeon]|nr:tRNA-intron lyase [Candidatus Bathyarchaeota archaeon]MBS7629500.1 tRNA-intron lyase [Candidatus Bathyarchaeota archaeon]
MVEAELMGSRLVVWNSEDGMNLYRSGFYGKPVGIPKPKPNQSFDSPLMLDLMEGIYLSNKDAIKVLDEETGREVSRKKLLKIACETYKDFEEGYIVYKDLRDKGYVVTPGIKFGADFAVYEHGPGIDHAPFIISVKKRMEKMSTFEIVRAGRLATTVRKQFIIATPDKKSGRVKYLVFRWFKA